MPAHAEDLAALGVQVITGSLFEPEHLRLLLHGATASFVATPLLDRVEDEIDLGTVLAAVHRDSTVEHLVFLSALGAGRSGASARRPGGRPGPGSGLDAKAEIEEALADTGLDVTFLLPGFLMENFRYLSAEIEAGTLALPAPVEAPFPVVAATDVAQAALVALARGPSGVERIPILAPERMSPEGLAEALAAALGHAVKAIAVTEGEYAGRLERAGLAPHRARHLAELAAHMGRWEEWGDLAPPAAGTLAASIAATPFAAFTPEFAGGRRGAPSPLHH
jgi:uncharacterized protein YbjT (DUF2867 family)